MTRLLINGKDESARYVRHNEWALSNAPDGFAVHTTDVAGFRKGDNVVLIDDAGAIEMGHIEAVVDGQTWGNVGIGVDRT